MTIKESDLTRLYFLKNIAEGSYYVTGYVYKKVIGRGTVFLEAIPARNYTETQDWVVLVHNEAGNYVRNNISDLETLQNLIDIL